MKSILKKEIGITLVALVITIIVLLILAGVSIAMLTGESGTLGNAEKAIGKSENAQIKENATLADYENKIGEYVGGTRDDNVVGINKLYAYNEEFIVGTWKDNQPVYRRIFEATTPSASGELLDISDLNIKEVFNLQGIVVKKTTSITDISRYDTQTNYCGIHINSNKILINGTADYLNCNIKVILDYTKN